MISGLPKISVITPSFNQGPFIERTIRSVLEQKYPELEYIIIDGGSKDETLDIIKEYEGRLSWLSEKDEGQADAINKGIRMSTGEIIAYLNSDDAYEPGALMKVGTFLKARQDVSWLTGRCRIINENDREIRQGITSYKNFLLRHFSYSMLLVTNPISQPSTFWRRRIVEEFGLFDPGEHLVMDYEYWLRIGSRYKPAILDEYLACFRVHHKSKTQSTTFENFRRELDVAKRYTDSHLLRTLHYLNYAGINAAYRALAALDRLRAPSYPIDS